MNDCYHSGIDYFTGDIDKPVETDLTCKACGTALKAVKVNGPRSWAGAMAKMTSEHWNYSCPNTPHERHGHLVELYREHRTLVSERLKAVVLGELEDKRKSFLAMVLTKKKESP
jgi:hypothetical protein